MIEFLKAGAGVALPCIVLPLVYLVMWWSRRRNL
jgi:hypothetical protein